MESLPRELQLEICGHMTDDALRTARLVSRGWSRVVYDDYTRRHFEHRVAYISKFSLGRLSRISRSPFAPAVRSVEFRITVMKPTKVDKKPKAVHRSRERQWLEQNAFLQAAVQDHHVWQYRDYSKLADIVNVTLKGLNRVESITVVDAADMSKGEKKKLEQETGALQLTKRNIAMHEDLAEYILYATFQHTMEHPRLKHLEISSTYSLNALAIPTFDDSTYPSLKTVRFSHIHPDQDDEGIHDYSYTCLAMLQLLQRCPNLEELYLSFHWTKFVVYRLFADWQTPKSLRVLELVGVRVKTTDLFRLLHMSRIQHITLRGIMLGRTSPDGIYEWRKVINFLATSPWLKSINISNVWEAVINGVGPNARPRLLGFPDNLNGQPISCNYLKDDTEGLPKLKKIAKEPKLRLVQTQRFTPCLYHDIKARPLIEYYKRRNIDLN